MRARDLDVCLLFNEPNIRYATGASAMPIYAMSTFVRCAVVPAEGHPILFEHGELDASITARRRRRAPDARVGVLRRPRRPRPRRGPRRRWTRSGSWACRATSWPSTGWARRGSSRCRRWASRSSTRRRRRRMRARSRRRRRSRCSRSTARWSSTCSPRSRRRSIPGVRERDLLAVLVRHDAPRAGASTSRRAPCAPGPNTNPWRSEATDRVVEPGDLVFVDTDTVGIEGYFFCVSRTFLRRATPSDLRAARHLPGVATTGSRA